MTPFVGEDARRRSQNIKREENTPRSGATKQQHFYSGYTLF